MPDIPLKMVLGLNPEGGSVGKCGNLEACTGKAQGCGLLSVFSWQESPGCSEGSNANLRWRLPSLPRASAILHVEGSLRGVSLEHDYQGFCKVAH